MFNLQLFQSKVDTVFKTASPDGYRYIICQGENILSSGSGGFTRTAIDPPMLPANITDRFNVASMSKTITAATLLSLLQHKNLSVDTLVAPFLPTNWVLHPTVKTLTFRDFLTHRTGFNEATDRSDFAGIKLSLEQGPPNPPKVNFDYRNINFAIFRILIPILNTYNRITKKVQFLVLDSKNEEAAYAAAYVRIVNERVLEPSGVPPADCNSNCINPPATGRPKPKTSVLLYEYKNPPNQHGVDYALGDRYLFSGAEGWALSVVDFSRFLQTLLFTEIIISVTNRNIMLSNQPGARLGLGCYMDPPVAGSPIFSHGGWIPSGKVQIASWWMYLSTRQLVVVALSNAGHNPNVPNWFDSVKIAYEEASK